MYRAPDFDRSFSSRKKMLTIRMLLENAGALISGVYELTFW